MLSPEAFGQNQQLVEPPPAAPQADTNSNRILWIIPNFRTTGELRNYQPISAAAKFKIARQDTFDRGTIALAGLFAGEAQLANSDRSFGQGVGGYAHYAATSYADFAVGNYMTEAVFPVLLHQDPRYFRRGHGSKLSRFGYSACQIFLTHGDSGRTQINFSEIFGNSAAVALSMAYYPDRRDVSDGLTSFGTQLAVDMASNILKEFGPEIGHMFSRKHKAAEPQP